MKEGGFYRHAAAGRCSRSSMCDRACNAFRRFAGPRRHCPAGLLACPVVGRPACAASGSQGGASPRQEESPRAAQGDFGIADSVMLSGEADDVDDARRLLPEAYLLPMIGHATQPVSAASDALLRACKTYLGVAALSLIQHQEARHRRRRARNDAPD